MVQDALNSNRVDNLSGIATAIAAFQSYERDHTGERLDQSGYDALVSWYDGYNDAQKAVNQKMIEQQSLVAKFVDAPTSFTVADYKALKDSHWGIDAAINQVNEYVGKYGYGVAIVGSGGVSATVTIAKH
jgi:hypothetical protein